MKKAVKIKEEHLCLTCQVKCPENLDGDTVVYRCDDYKKEKKNEGK
jgi:uncharacterized lipoprotein YmbA